MDARAPQGLVDVDVPQSRERSLVEERRLDRRLALRQSLAEARDGEERVERLVAELGRDVWVDLVRLEQEPGPEAPDVAVGDPRPVVELQHGAFVRSRLQQEPA